MTEHPAAPSDYEVEFARWLHMLRNELNTITMASAAASGLFDVGAGQPARENLQRAREACKRCSTLLADPPATRRDRG